MRNHDIRLKTVGTSTEVVGFIARIQSKVGTQRDLGPLTVVEGSFAVKNDVANADRRAWVRHRKLRLGKRCAVWTSDVKRAVAGGSWISCSRRHRHLGERNDYRNIEAAGQPKACQSRELVNPKVHARIERVISDLVRGIVHRVDRPQVLQIDAIDAVEGEALIGEREIEVVPAN